MPVGPAESAYDGRLNPVVTKAVTMAIALRAPLLHCNFEHEKVPYSVDWTGTPR